ncbi:MAG: universal stress protein [Planctomycetota bacterium]|nr:universal stress protein [Planctomycetota bacterium]
MAAAVDFTAGSRVALHCALRIAARDNATVHPIHVIDTLVATELEEALSPYQKDLRAGLVRDAQLAWDSWRSASPGAAALPLDVRIDTRVMGILRAAADAKADLLVAGAYGTTRPDVGMGTVATACVRYAAMDVLLVRDTHPAGFRRIVACVDFSQASRAVVADAARIAAQDGAELHLLHVFRAPWHELHYPAPTPGADPRLQKQYRDGLEGRLRAFCDQCRDDLNGVTPVRQLQDDRGHRSGIVEYAANVQADLIVLGTRGKSNIRDIVLGSTAEKVLRDTPCSVLAVRVTA